MNLVLSVHQTVSEYNWRNSLCCYSRLLTMIASGSPKNNQKFSPKHSCSCVRSRLYSSFESNAMPKNALYSTNKPLSSSSLLPLQSSTMTGINGLKNDWGSNLHIPETTTIPSLSFVRPKYSFFQWKTRSQSLSRPKPLSPKPPSCVSATGGLCDSKTWARFYPLVNLRLFLVLPRLGPLPFPLVEKPSQLSIILHTSLFTDSTMYPRGLER